MKISNNKWIIASRPKTLFASISPVIVGSALAHHFNSFKILPAMLAFVCSVLIQIGTNFINDLYDFKTGKDTKKRVGPTRVLASGLTSSKEMKIAIFLVFFAALILGIYLSLITSKWLLLVGFLSLLSGYLYTAGPFPLAYNGLGDIFVFLFFGVVAVTGTFFIQTLQITFMVVFVSFICGALITNILVVNNYRDIDEDSSTGKRTLAVIFGKKFTKLQFIGLSFLPYLVVILCVYYFHLPKTVLFTFASLPLTLVQISKFNNSIGSELNKALELTAKNSFITSLIFSFSLIIG